MQQFIKKETIDFIKDHLLKTKQSIAIAESVTSGFLQLAFSLATEASKVFHGGITVYNIGQKYRHLNVDPIHALSCNCVSDRVAADMALNVCNLFTSNWGIGITGYASPMPDSDNQLFAYYAIAYNKNIVLADKLTVTPQEPFAIQLFYTEKIIESLYTYLSNEH